jgi:hypothetical protein
MKALDLSDLSSSTQASPSIQVLVLAQTEECERFDQLLGQEHFLGSRHPSGHTLRQVVVENGQWVALLLWVSGFWHLKDRDQWIGWDALTEAERIKLIVHNARFLVPEAARRPNLASQALAAAVRALPKQWHEQFAYEPLLAETFSDPEAHAGTVYKVTGWIPVGQSSGNPPGHRCDYFPGAKRPKRLWIKALHPQAKQRLCAAELAPEYQAALNQQPTVRCVLNSKQRASLSEVFRSVPDPRARSGRRYPLSAVLTIVALALLRGAIHLATIHRTGLKLDQRQRAQLNLPFKKGTRFRAAPGYFVYRDILAALDLERLAEVLTGWLQSQTGQLPRTLAIDGKIIRQNLGLIVTLVDAEEGTPVAVMADVRGEGHELKTAQKLLASPTVNLHHATVTTDSLHCQDETAHGIVLDKGGDFLLQIRDNQPTLHALAQTKLERATPLLPRPKAITGALRSAK